MKTIFVTANDTVVGKTWTTRVLAKYLVSKSQSVQVVKSVETGFEHYPMEGDSLEAIRGLDKKLATSYTLFNFRAPLAPVTAAHKAGSKITLNQFIKKLEQLPTVDWRIIEGAGGLACPIDAAGYDFRDLINTINIDYLVMVIENRIGAINQSRLLDNYASTISAKRGFWLNSKTPTHAETENSNIHEISFLKTPIWHVQRHNVDDFYDTKNIFLEK